MMITDHRAKPNQTELNVYVLDEIQNAIILAVAAPREITGFIF